MIAAVARAVLASRGAWWAPALLAALASLLIGVCFVQVTASGGDEYRRIVESSGLSLEDIEAVGLSITMIIVPTATVVLAVVNSAAVGQLTGDLSRWRLIGAAPTTLSALVLAQLLLAVGAGAAVGAVCTFLVGGLLARILNAMLLPELGGLTVQPTAGALAGALLLPIGIAVVAGIPGAVRAARVPALRTIRDSEAAPPRTGARHWVGSGLGLMGLGVAAGAAFRSPGNLDDGGALTVGLGLGLLVLVVAGIGARVLVPGLVLSWTAVLPFRDAVWVLARAGAVARARSSGAAVVALACGTGMLGTLTGMARTTEAIARASGPARQFNLLDTYVICGALGVLCAVGGACVIALGALDRRRETALLRAAGCSPRQVLLHAACEALILTVSSLLVALAATAAAIATVVRAAAADDLPLRLVLPIAELGISGVVMFLVLLGALLIPASRALRTSVRTSLGAA